MWRHLVFVSTAIFSIAEPATAMDPDKAIACPGFPDGRASQVDADHFYALRAVEILSAALADDKTRLKRLVSPQAGFSIWDGDHGMSPRDSLRQPLPTIEALIWLTGRIMPRRYSMSVRKPGPVSVNPAKECKWDVTLLLVGNRTDEGHTATFSFSNGLLMQATATTVVLFEGKIPN